MIDFLLTEDQDLITSLAVKEEPQQAAILPWFPLTSNSQAPVHPKADDIAQNPTPPSQDPKISTYANLQNLLQKCNHILY